MDDFEYSVEISDRDWDGFFAECEECNLLPPSLAGVDDSGMSDIDDQGFILAQQAQRINPALSISEIRRINESPDCDKSPVEHCLGRLDSVLSGSEEDLHLQSVNIFFERLKGLTDAELNQQIIGNNREVLREEEQRGSGHQPSRSNLPKIFSKTSTLLAKDEIAAGKEAVKPIDINRNINPEQSISFEPAASTDLVTTTFKPAEEEFKTREQAFGESELHRITNSSQQSDLDKIIATETTQQYLRGEPVKNNEGIEPDQVVLRKKSFTKEEYGPTPESSPFSSTRKKRKKKKRLSTEASDGGPVCEKQVSVNQSDSEEEQCVLRERASGTSSQDSLPLNEPQNVTTLLTTTNLIKNWSLNLSTDEIKNQKSESSLNQSKSNVRVTNTAHKATPSHVCSKIQLEQLEWSKNKNTSNHLKCSDTKLGNEQTLNESTTEIKSVTLSTCAESCAPSMEVSQDDKVSATKSVLAVETGNSGREKNLLRQNGTEPQEQLESDGHHTSQCNLTLEKTHLYPSAMIVKSSEALNTKSNSNQPENRVSWPEDFKSNPSDITHITSCTLDIESLTSFSNENHNDVSATFCSSAVEQDSAGQEEKNVSIMTKVEETHLIPEGKTTPESKCGFPSDAENVINTPTSVNESVKGNNSVFAMSSFWKEMEKLTINDILGLRKISKASLTPVQESEETDMFTVTDPGIFTAVDESKPEEITEKTITSSTSIMWESEPLTMSRSGNIYEVDTMLTPVIDTSQPLLTESNEKGFKKISKTITVHNLQALESEPSSYLYQNEILQTTDDKKSGHFQYFSDEHPPKQRTNNYSISLTDIFKSLLGGKQPVPHQPVADDIPTICTGGKSVPETYDEFFSEFDTENFFYSLVKSEEKKPIPIFSYPRSSGRNLQYPEAYEYFFASSSSDDSSVESDEEENHRPLRVVSRFSHKASSTKLFTDMYEDFFTERDFKENFFCLKSLSFRKTRFAASATQRQSSKSTSLVPVRQKSTSDLRAAANPNVLGNQDTMFPDPLLYHLEDRISRTLEHQSFRYEELQTPVSNPGLDAPLLPFKQSDMCLVCIAFASWVLKTANPQAGDAWKAVLLANVSALSAIRYLRKYFRTQAVETDMKSNPPAITYP